LRFCVVFIALPRSDYRGLEQEIEVLAAGEASILQEKRKIVEDFCKTARSELANISNKSAATRYGPGSG
jgi:hypothetical protein